jgi:hypothetical protein
VKPYSIFLKQIRINRVFMKSYLLSLETSLCALDVYKVLLTLQLKRVSPAMFIKCTHFVSEGSLAILILLLFRTEHAHVLGPSYPLMFFGSACQVSILAYILQVFFGRNTGCHLGRLCI